MSINKDWSRRTHLGDGYASVTFSPDSKNYAGYTVNETFYHLYENDWYDENIFFREIRVPVYSPDSNKLAAIIKPLDVPETDFEYSLIVKSGKDYKQWDCVFSNCGNPVFSPNSQDIAVPITFNQWEQDNKTTWTIAINGKFLVEKTYDRCMNLHFSPDGDKIMFNAVKDKNIYRVVKNINEFKNTK